MFCATDTSRISVCCDKQGDGGLRGIHIHLHTCAPETISLAPLLRHNKYDVDISWGTPGSAAMMVFSNPGLPARMLTCIIL